jgi:hypothetical protein
MCTENAQTSAVFISRVDKMLVHMYQTVGHHILYESFHSHQCKNCRPQKPRMTILKFTHKWEDNIKVDLTEMRSYSVGFIQIVEDKGAMLDSCEHDNETFNSIKPNNSQYTE